MNEPKSDEEKERERLIEEMGAEGFTIDKGHDEPVYTEEMLREAAEQERDPKREQE